MALTEQQRAEALAIRAAMDTAGSVLTDEQALRAINLYRYWAAGETVATGDKRRYGNGLYRCREGHTTQDNWAPDRAGTLWARITVQDWEVWQSGSLYGEGAKVTHNGRRWISGVDNNHWEPGAIGVGDNIWAEAI